MYYSSHVLDIYNYRFIIVQDCRPAAQKHSKSNKCYVCAVGPYQGFRVNCRQWQVAQEQKQKQERLKNTATRCLMEASRKRVRCNCPHNTINLFTSHWLEPQQAMCIQDYKCAFPTLLYYIAQHSYPLYVPLFLPAGHKRQKLFFLQTNYQTEGRPPQEMIENSKKTFSSSEIVYQCTSKVCSELPFLLILESRGGMVHQFALLDSINYYCQILAWILLCPLTIVSLFLFCEIKNKLSVYYTQLHFLIPVQFSAAC